MPTKAVPTKTEVEPLKPEVEVPKAVTAPSVKEKPAGGIRMMCIGVSSSDQQVTVEETGGGMHDCMRTVNSAEFVHVSSEKGTHPKASAKVESLEPLGFEVGVEYTLELKRK